MTTSTTTTTQTTTTTLTSTTSTTTIKSCGTLTCLNGGKLNINSCTCECNEQLTTKQDFSK